MSLGWKETMAEAIVSMKEMEQLYREGGSLAEEEREAERALDRDMEGT